MRAEEESIRKKVRERYAGISPGRESSCGSACCGGIEEGSGACCDAKACATDLGYSPEDLAGLPDGANLGLGCGNPTALLSLHPGETVLDLGSGGGVDCFLAAERVGPDGHVIGVDMTPDMVARARASARRSGRSTVEFRLGEMEHLPVADASVDVVISNCVINLAPDKAPVYREAFRALRPGGRLAVSDMVARRPVPEEARRDLQRWSSCSSGALTVAETSRVLRAAGFVEVRVESARPDETLPLIGGPDNLGIVPASIRALKPEIAMTATTALQ